MLEKRYNPTIGNAEPAEAAELIFLGGLCVHLLRPDHVDPAASAST
jgi:hypothetical protein